MTPEQFLYDVLRNDSAITAIVGDRIYSDSTPEDVAVPCLVTARVGSAAYERILSGSVVAERVAQEVHCAARTRSAAEALGDAVIAALTPQGFDATNRTGEQDESGEDDVELSILSFERWHC